MNAEKTEVLEGQLDIEWPTAGPTPVKKQRVAGHLNTRTIRRAQMKEYFKELQWKDSTRYNEAAKRQLKRFKGLSLIEKINMYLDVFKYIEAEAAKRRIAKEVKGKDA